jgi:hypothetical protein
VTFILPKQALAVVIGGLLMLGVLLFVGGFLTGARFALRTQPEQTDPPRQVTEAPADAAVPIAPGGATAPTAAIGTPPDGPAPEDATDPTAVRLQGADSAAPGPAAVAPPASAPAIGGDAPPSEPAPEPSDEAPPPAAETADDLAIEPPLPMLVQPPSEAGAEPTLAPVSVPLQANPLTGPLPPPPPTDQNPRPFALQAGAFLDKGNADRLTAELEERGYAVSVLRTRDAGEREWFRVRVGHFTTLAQAKAAAQAFRAKERMAVDVVRQAADAPQK